MEKCPICLEPRPLQGHHVTPIEYGGPVDQKLFYLCGTCHLAIHHTAEGLTSKKGLTCQYLTPDQLSRSMNLIQAIIKAKNSFVYDPENTRKLMVTIPDWLLVRLHKRKYDRGFTSLEKYVISLLRSDVSNL